MEEVWKPIPYSTYEASNLGQIRNLKNGKIQAPQMGVDGYLFVGVRFLDKKHSISIHRLVCLAFHGLKPTGATCVRHLDGDRMNNTPGNLAWGTFVENAADTILHGRQVSGFDHPNVSITKEDALAIRQQHLSHIAETGKKKARNGFISDLNIQFPHLSPKAIYKAANGKYDHLLPGEVHSAASRISIYR